MRTGTPSPHHEHHAHDGHPPDLPARTGHVPPVSLVASTWAAVPAWLRRTIVAVVGVSLVLLGLALVVLPGPFTLPLLLAGFFVLGTEFAWAAAALARTRRELDRAGQLSRRAARSVTSTVGAALPSAVRRTGPSTATGTASPEPAPATPEPATHDPATGDPAELRPGSDAASPSDPPPA